MALDAAIVWEFRTSGNNDNGGGFKTGASGTDYSQQDAAQLTLSDLAMTTGGTTLTSATGGFTDAMIGNVIYIKSGTNFTAGWYEITARADTNTVTIDRDATNGSNASSGTGSVGGARALPTDAFFEALTAGNTVYIKAGTYTLTASITVLLDGTATNYLKIYGYNSTRGDNPTGSNQPLILCAGYTFEADDYWEVKNIRTVGTTSTYFRFDTGAKIRNCCILNNSGTADRIAAYLGSTYIFVMDCECISINGVALQLGSYCFAYFNYCHDSKKGCICNNAVSIISNIFANCSTSGIEPGSASRLGLLVNNNTFYNCGTALNLQDINPVEIINNIIDSNTTGVSADASADGTKLDYNNFHGNSTDVSNVTKGANDTANDPEFEFVGVRGTDDSGVGNKATSMVDTSENFTTLGVTVGDTILNKTDGSWGTITSISTTTNPNDTVNFSGGLTGGTDNDFDNGDTYSILGNFSLKSTSDCIDAAFSIRLGVG